MLRMWLWSKKGWSVMSEKAAKRQRKLKKQADKILKQIINEKTKLTETAIKNYMDKKNLTIQDLKNHGIMQKLYDGTEIYKYKNDIVIKIKVIYENEKVKIIPESEYLNGGNKP